VNPISEPTADWLVSEQQARPGSLGPMTWDEARKRSAEQRQLLFAGRRY
jgi:hypothetical protein